MSKTKKYLYFRGYPQCTIRVMDNTPDYSTLIGRFYKKINVALYFKTGDTIRLYKKRTGESGYYVYRVGDMWYYKSGNVGQVVLNRG